jgi:hypothetical protein
MGRRLPCNPMKWSFFTDTFKPVPGKSAQDKDDHKDDNLDKNAKHSQETGIDACAFGNKIHSDEHEDDSQDNTGNRTIPQEAGVVFLSVMIKSKNYAKDEIQQFQPHTRTLNYGCIVSLLSKRFRMQWAYLPGISEITLYQFVCFSETDNLHYSFKCKKMGRYLHQKGVLFLPYAVVTLFVIELVA